MRFRQHKVQIDASLQLNPKGVMGVKYSWIYGFLFLLKLFINIVALFLDMLITRVFKSR